MHQTIIFDRAAASFGRPFTLAEITDKLHDDPEWNKTDSYISRCIAVRMKSRAIIKSGNEYTYSTTADTSATNTASTTHTAQTKPEKYVRLMINRIAVDNYLQYKKDIFIANSASTTSFQPSDKLLSNNNHIREAGKRVLDSGIIFQSDRNSRPTWEDAGVPEAINALADAVYNLLNPRRPINQEDFDAFHDEQCTALVAAMNPIVTAHNYPNPFKYGNAQKMVNILFKYLSCFSDYSIYKEYFNYCHTPIDSIILDVFQKAFSVPRVSSSKYNAKTWTKLDRPDYISLRDAYRECAKEKTPYLSWLDIDFFYWK